MARLDGRIAYIFGAGASADAGAPVLSQFLGRARELYRRNDSDLHYENSFRRIFTWIDEMKLSPIEITYDNLEEVFSLITILRESGDKDAEELEFHLKNVVCETLDSSIHLSRQSVSTTTPNLEDLGKTVQVTGPEFVDPAYAMFVEALLKNDRRRKKEMRQEHYKPDVLISFNYDLLLDYMLEGFGANFSYGGLQEDHTFVLCKLHGSLNWAKNPSYDAAHGAGERIKILSLRDVLEVNAEKSTAKLRALALLNASNHQNCDGHTNNILESVIIPPTWTKSPRNYGLQTVWSKAMRELADVEQIVIIGYSMPESDTFFRYLLAHSFKGGSFQLKRVLIVDSGDGPIQTRYARMFPPKIKVEHYRNRFEGWARDRNGEANGNGAGAPLYMLN